MAATKLAAMPPFAVARAVDWRVRLPTLSDGGVTLRQLRSADAASLVRHLHRDRVSEFSAPCPGDVEQFRRFIRWSYGERRRGSLLCFGIVPEHTAEAVGVIQLWPVERDFFTAEWGFVLGEAFWGTGLFARGAALALDFAFDTLGVFRLEARAVEGNRRGGRALEKLGAVRDGVLRGGYRDGHVARNHVMWSILAPEWRAGRKLVADAS